MLDFNRDLQQHNNELKVRQVSLENRLDDTKWKITQA